MTQLKALVMKSTEKSKHSIVAETGAVQVGRPAWLEISSTENGVYLTHFNDDGQSLADTWHATIDEAKSQVEVEFGIHATQWSIVE